MTGTGTIRAAFAGRLGVFDLDAAFSVPSTGVTALFGPSGSGKTTVLRCIAGLQRLPRGHCAVDGDIWQDDTLFLPCHRRPIGYVFQEPSLFPHLSVSANLLYGAPRGRAPDRQAISFDEMVALLGLAPLLDRSPRNLSGGERQRVAVGRALLSNPKLLLMDEPLAALDRQAKDEILPFLESLHATLALPILYVSHDLAEVERLADHLVLMQAGRVKASGPLAELQGDPALPLAVRRDAAVSLEAVVVGSDRAYGLVELRVGEVRFVVPGAPRPAGEKRRVRIAASDVSLALEAPGASTMLNVFPVRIRATIPDGNEIVAVLGLDGRDDGARLLARVTRRSWEALGLAPGLAVYAQVKGVALVSAASH